MGSLLNKDTTLKGKPFLSLTQIHLEKKNNAWDTLIAFNKNMINPIILATEPYSNTNNIIPKINQNLSAHYCSNGTSKLRAAILIHKNLENHSRELKQFTTPDQVAIHIKHKDREIIFASIYMGITHDIPPTQSIPLINYANNNKLPLIKGSDTNAQHTLWGNRECNKASAAPTKAAHPLSLTLGDMNPSSTLQSQTVLVVIS